jgi:hypothetical protein
MYNIISIYFNYLVFVRLFLSHMDWMRLEKLWKILTCLGFIPTHSHSIHMDWEQNEQAFNWCDVVSMRMEPNINFFVIT